MEIRERLKREKKARNLSGKPDGERVESAEGKSRCAQIKEKENRCNLTIYSDFEYSVTKIISEL